MKIFISHSTKDKEIAGKLAKMLKENQLDVWYDGLSFQPGDSIVNTIEKGIADSSTLIVLLSEESIKSYWVKSEINAFLNRAVSDSNITIIPVLLDKVAIPVLLLDKFHFDFSNEIEAGMSELIRHLLEPNQQCKRLPDEILIDDFNRGLLGQNKLGGLTLVFHENGDPSSLNATFVNRGKGKAIALSYDFTHHSLPTVPPQFVGYSTRLQFANWKEYFDCDYWLSFDAWSDGNAKVIQIEIKKLINPQMETNRQEIAKCKIDLPLDWGCINLRLRDIAFPELPWDNLWEICFVFFRDKVVGDKGTVQIDNLCLCRHPR